MRSAHNIPRAIPSPRKIHVVIPFYHGHDDLPALLTSLDQNTHRPDHIWIVDNSDDDARLHSLSIPVETPTSILRAQSRIGFGRASNLGAWQASERGATHICVLNQDGFADPQMLEHLLNDLDETSATLIAPLVVDPGSRSISPFVARLYVPEAIRSSEILSPGQLPQQPRYEPHYLCGAALLFPVSLFHRTGLFDPLFTMYGEDRDLCERARRIGARLVLSRAARFNHAHTNATATGSKRAQLLTWQSESHAVRRMRSAAPSPLLDRIEEAVLWCRASFASGPRCAFKAVSARRQALTQKFHRLKAARDGESLLERTHACAIKDLLEIVHDQP